METLDLPAKLNAATVFIDRHLDEGRADKPAILCGDTTVTYRDLAENVNRFGNAMLSLGIRTEERIAIIMPDSHECVFAFFGAIKIGAVAIPLNTNLKPDDYEYLLNDSRSQALVIDASLVEKLNPIREKLRYLKHIIVARGNAGTDLSFDKVMKEASAELEPADLSKDDSAFWLYSSGTTGFPKGTIHMVVVDPGVGGKRKPIILKTQGSFFVGPDNGLFTFVYPKRHKVFLLKYFSYNRYGTLQAADPIHRFCIVDRL